jgi:predicted kinase
MGNFKTFGPDSLPPMLIIFGRLPGTGKTTIARELSSQLGAMYVRVDSIEQAIRDSGTMAEPI